MSEFEHGAEARKHVIMSHGGKHGPGGTYLRGAMMSPEVAKHLPKEYIAPAAPGTVLPAQVQIPTPNPVLTAQTPPQVPAEPVVPPQVTPPERPGQPKPLLPTNARELQALSKEDLTTLARDNGITIEGEVTIKALREALKVGLGLGG